MPQSMHGDIASLEVMASHPQATSLETGCMLQEPIAKGFSGRCLIDGLQCEAPQSVQMCGT